MSDTFHDAMTTLHQGLVQEGPGDDDSTREALRRLPPLPRDPIVLDLGCGPGRQTLALAETLGTRIVAIDLHPPYLDQLVASAAARGIAQRVEPRCADIGALDVPPGSVDLIWSEGAAYILGFAESLRRWRPLLKPHGVMALTECTWLTDTPPRDASAFWHDAYPAMGTLAANCGRAEAAGLRVLDTFPLPASAWWTHYYTPLLERVAHLRPTADAPLAALLDETEREIELFRRHSESYGYVFFLMTRTS